MKTDGKEKQCDSKGERRISKRPRRRLVDLTLKAGTNRRECKEDRRKESAEGSTPRPGSGQAERLSD
ncbi:MAG: hypothetical protein RRA15_11745 [bacterium]|nr:hypothetical protein [bacterium]MDT8367139.1 hypothetical protein [bacterium]